MSVCCIIYKGQSRSSLLGCAEILMGFHCLHDLNSEGHAIIHGTLLLVRMVVTR